ncbi:hypothetical protein [Kitasatospora griseola]|uniref:hypothetical protein n=1 Tax=Kitasatospora griseola TaxID=2064 RepID=UPI0038156372
MRLRRSPGRPLLGQAYLHRSRRPLAEAPIDRLGRAELRALQQLTPAEEELENGPEDGCSPFSCRSGEAVA